MGLLYAAVSNCHLLNIPAFDSSSVLCSPKSGALVMFEVDRCSLSQYIVFYCHRKQNYHQFAQRYNFHFHHLLLHVKVSHLCLVQ